MDDRFRGITEKVVEVYLPYMGWDQKEVLIKRLYGLNPGGSKSVGYDKDVSKQHT